MDVRADIINRLTDMREVIDRTLGFLEAGQMAFAWHALNDQEQTDSLKDLMAELERAVPEWQMRGFQSEAAYLNFQRRNPGYK